MLLLQVTVLSGLLQLSECSIVKHLKDNYLFSNAVAQVLNQFSGKFNSGLYVFIPSNDEASEDLASDVVSKVKVPVQIEDKIRIIKDRRRYYCLLIINTFEEFMSFHDQLAVERFYFMGFYFVAFPNIKPQEMNLIFDLLWKRFIFNVNIIAQSPTTIEMFTFMPFRIDGKCGDETPVKINEFDRKSMSWLTNPFFPKKFTDLHKCPIKSGSFRLEPATIIERHEDGSVEVHGFDVDIINALMHSVNAVVKHTVFPISTGSIYPNGTSTGLLGHTIRGDVDISMRTWSLQLDRRVKLSETVSYFSDKLIMIMPQPLPLNPLLKFVRPLKAEVWIALAAIVLIACIVIVLANFIPSNYYKRIIGKNLRDEFLNILIGFIGSSQNSLPEKNFPRFLLMMFLIFCLIIRSLYLGSLFNMLKTEIRTKEFVSIHDFFDAGFHFYMYETLSERVNYTDINKR